MAKINFQSNPRVHQIFDDLSQYLEFCRNYGYRYDEKELYDNKSYSYRQFSKYLQNKEVKNNWLIDARP
jgi:hypothetical protein